MAHIVEVERRSEAEACSFLDALYYSDSVSAIGFRPQGEKFIAVAVNWDAEETSELGRSEFPMRFQMRSKRAAIWTKFLHIAKFFRTPFHTISEWQAD